MNKVKTLTPELDEILDYHYWQLDKTKEENRRDIAEFKAKLNTYYLNLFMECRPDGRLIKSDEQERDKGFNEAIYLFEDNLKNKLGADWN